MTPPGRDSPERPQRFSLPSFPRPCGPRRDEVTSLLVQAILDVWDHIKGSLGGRLSDQFTRLRDAAEPPVGIVLSGPDGSSYTGIVVVERNKAILLLAFCEPGGIRPVPSVTAHRRSHAPAYDRGEHDPPYGRSELSLCDQERHPLEDDEPHWRR
jgi:hypothetical protein